MASVQRNVQFRLSFVTLFGFHSLWNKSMHQNVRQSAASRTTYAKLQIHVYKSNIRRLCELKTYVSEAVV